MDINILTKVIKETPSTVKLTMHNIVHMYNDKAPIPIRHRDLMSYLSNNPEIKDKFLQTKEERHNKIQLAMQEAEDALIENATRGDIRSIEFLLKSLHREYKEKQELKVTLGTSEGFLEQIKKKQEDIMDADIIPAVLENNIQKEEK